MQQIAVILIGIFAFGCVAWRTYRLLAGKKKSGSPCAGCSGGCALRDCGVKAKDYTSSR